MTSTKPTPQPTTEEATTNPARRRSWKPLAVVAVVVVAALIYWFLPANTDSQVETFETPIDRVVVEVTGSVDLVAGDRTELTITKEWVLSMEPTIDASTQSGIARLTGDCPWFHIRCITSVSGTVASDASVQVITRAGSIEVSGTTGGLDLKTSAGWVNVDGVSGPARLITSAGEIVGDIRDGDVEAQTSAGRIDLSVLGEFSSVSAITSAGDIDLVVADEVYDLYTDTSAGSIRTSVRTDPAAERDISAETSAGSITISPAP